MNSQGSSTEILSLASGLLLEPAGLSITSLETVLGSMLGRQVDDAELYFQLIRQESWSLEECQVKDGSYHTCRGVGVRACAGEKTGFAYSDDITPAALLQAAQAAGCIARAGQDKKIAAWSKRQAVALYPDQDPLCSLNHTDKVAVLTDIDRLARSLDPRVVQVDASLSGSYEVVLVVASDGTLAADARPLVRLNVSVMVEEAGRREVGYHGGGGRYDYQTLLHGDKIAQFTRKALDAALINLRARPAPAGTMPVVLGPGWPGVLLHEAVGHGLEADFNRKGHSAFADAMGQRVASTLCTVVDDGTLAGARGSLSVDDEGCATACTTLIEDGILKGYMYDKLNARLMGARSTGNGRRESYAHLPMPRMTNTYMLPGKHHPEEIIQSVKKGIYAVNFGGGQVDITNGKFVFSANEAYLIENGQVTTPLKGATLIGDGPDVLTKVSMLGNDLQLDEGVGVCGKDGQSVPVGVGQPTMLIDEMTVGGTDGSL